MTWVLTPAMRRLRAEVDAIAPQRDRSSDGSIGDQAHASGASGHNPDETGRAEYTDSDRVNEVRAIDLDGDLRTPGLTMEDIVQQLVRRCRTGAERRLAYIIYRRRIWGDGAGWREQPYYGANPHDQHAHVSGRPAGDEDTSSYHLAELAQGKEDDMFDEKALAKLNALYALAFSGGPSCGAEVDPGNNDRGKSNSIVNKLDALLETASHPPVAVQVDAAQVAAALAANTGFLAAVAQAVNDDQSRRLAQ